MRTAVKGDLLKEEDVEVSCEGFNSEKEGEVTWTEQ